MEISEIEQWIQQWFDASLGEAEAEALFGPAMDTTATIARATPSDPRFRSVVYERVRSHGGFLSGVQLSLAKPESLDWKELVSRYEEPKHIGVPWDHWGSPVMYAFRVRGNGLCGMFIVAIRGKPQDTVELAELTLRRFPPDDKPTANE